MDEPLIGGSSRAGKLRRILLLVFSVVFVTVAVLSIAALAVSVQARKDANKPSSSQTTPPVTCGYDASHPDTLFPQSTRASLYDHDDDDDAPSLSSYVWIQHATLWSDGKQYNDYDIIIFSDGIISEVGPHPLTPPSGPSIVIYDVKGSFVTPGLVDMHSHAGVYAAPDDAVANSDGNELSNPTTPQVRAIDAFDPEDPAIPLILSGGVTSSQVLPGSGNTIGGEALMVKMRGKTIADMLIAEAPRAFKMAAGENPKRVYGSKGDLPMTRMGNIWTMRQKFASARTLMQQQDQWDCQVKSGKSAAPRPFEESLESMVTILRGEAVLNVHCYTIQDFEAILRVADEFNVRVSAFHHALEAWKVPELFLARNITIATFADHWGFKMEGYDGSVFGPKILDEAGVKVALKSDHPVLDARHLIDQASRAYHYGMDPNSALASVTSVPASAMGLGHLVGSVAAGYHGDIVVWSRHALSVGATPLMVFVEGELLVNNSAAIKANPDNQLEQVNRSAFKFSGPQACVASSGGGLPAPPLPKNADYLIKGVQLWTMTSGTPVTNTNIHVVNGNVSCIGDDVACPEGTTALNVFDFTGMGAVATPGMISSGSYLGMMEVDQEMNSWDGIIYTDDASSVHAVDGVKMGGRHLHAAWAGGVTTHIARPQGPALLAGVSAAFTTYGQHLEDAIVKDQVALHISIGNVAKLGTLSASVAGQISLLRKFFKSIISDSINGVDDPLLNILNGTLPIVVHADQADEIAAFLRLRREVLPWQRYPLVKITLFGGAEATLVADRLLSDNISVVLSPLKAFPMRFETMRSVGIFSAAGLFDAGLVTIGQAIEDSGGVRDIRWEAGDAREVTGLSTYQALSTVTSGVADALHLTDTGLGRVTQGKPANLVVWLGDPLDISSTVALVAVGQIADCKPLQY
eukprot:TRINITY_DN1631_c0_g1_i6.p1 TRINITY_DN1631_c0_g1~~TRINITY_DN1631_c0_g1_i6.p1  ORF type:complete len:919 (-),score=171.48 TRINITY_DN1631_c0_g1_i6:80-2836(-)